MKKLCLSALLLSLAALAVCSIPSFSEHHPASPGVIAYTDKDGLWIKELPGHDAKKLVSGGDILKPRFSFSGRWLAYTKYSPKKSELWLISRNGTGSLKAATLSIPCSFTWSPSEDILAYAAEDDTLQLYDAEKMTDRKLVKLRYDKHFSWSPDGRWLAVELSAISIGRIGVDGTSCREIFSMGSSSKDGLWLADWSPDGKDILFWLKPSFGLSAMADGVPLFAFPAGGGKPRKLVSRALIYKNFRAYSPDRRYLAVTDGSNREIWTDKRIALIEMATGSKSVLTPNGVSAFSPAWSPDGKHIAYVEGPDIGSVGGGEKAKAGVRQRRIWIINKDGSDRHQLIRNSPCREERPQWSPDGQSILFFRIDGKEQVSLWLAGKERNNPTPAVTILNDITPGVGYYGGTDWDDYLTWWKGH